MIERQEETDPVGLARSQHLWWLPVAHTLDCCFEVAMGNLKGVLVTMNLGPFVLMMLPKVRQAATQQVCGMRTASKTNWLRLTDAQRWADISNKNGTTTKLGGVVAIIPWPSL